MTTANDNIAALKAAYEAAKAEFGADVEAARVAVAHWESFHNGAIREERGEAWYLSHDATVESRAIDDEMATHLPRVMDYVNATEPYIDTLLAEVERLRGERDAAHATLNEIARAITDAFPGRAFDPTRLAFHVDELVSALMLAKEKPAQEAEHGE